MKAGKLLIGSALIWACLCPAQADTFDHSLYDSVLHQYVDDEGRVDYAEIALNSMTALESYFERLGDADLAGWPEAERLAFWINAYNARVIYLVAQRPALKKISDDFALFNKPFKIAGRNLSLNDIKHSILRGTLNKEDGQGPIPVLSFKKVDPRIHFALVNGALGGPRLRNAAYTSDTLEAVLQIDAAAFVNSSAHVRVDNNHLQLSTLFKWYADDFKSAGGVPAYVSSLLSPDQNGDAQTIQELLKTAFAKSVFTFDFTVNRQNTGATMDSPNAPAPEEIPPDAFSTTHPEHIK